MTLKIYGQSQSRAVRVLWMAEELGLAYEHVATSFGDAGKTPELLEVNPNGRVPAIDDDGFRLFESMAINLYLAKRHGGDLAPRDAREEALATQWSFWVMTEIEKTLLQALFLTLGMMGAEKDAQQAAAHVEELQRPLGVLNGALEGRDYLVGERFSVADLNVASVLIWIKIIRTDLSAHPNVQAWLERCLAREALNRARAKP